MWGLKSSNRRYNESDEDESPYAVLPATPSPPPSPSTFMSSPTHANTSRPVDLPPPPSESESESDLEEDENVVLLKNSGKRKRRAGRKSTWRDVELDELTDVICSSDIFKRDILFTNSKNRKNGNIYEKVIENLSARFPFPGTRRNMDENGRADKKQIQDHDSLLQEAAGNPIGHR